MSDVESVVKTTMGEIEKLLNTKTVVGDPMVVDGTTLIPLVSIGFAFGAGAGTGKMSQKTQQEGTGGGTGGGAGVRPIAVIIVDKDGTRIESIRGGLSSALEKVVEKTASVIMQRREGQSQPKEEAK